ncbi:MAG: mevalonate kinase family protein [Bdellovibrionales bacterium]
MKDQVFSKVILCGEHSVLRGGMAIVAPLKAHSLSYDIETSESFNISYADKVKPYEILFEGTIDKALSILNKTRADLKVSVHVETIVPLGKGLGGSAAVSVFIARVMKFLNFIEDERTFSFSVELENMFHGESSGVDIAGCLSSGPQSYLRGEPLKEISSNLKDIFFGLVETGEVGETEVCIEQVLKIKLENKELFQELDFRMDQASKELVSALNEGSLEGVKDAFGLAKSAFMEWKLVTPKMGEKMKELMSKGALAVKPTGAGMGGYILSVWSDEDLAKKACSKVFKLF